MTNILLAVCGTTPQILTETLYGLQKAQKFPHKVIVLTTQKGKELAVTSLFSPNSAVVRQFCADYNIKLSEFDFSPQSFYVPCLASGKEIEDIITKEDSHAFLHACMEHVFTLTKDPATCLSFSLAGGRKTMGACLALAAQCYGRAQDMAFHVLVSAEFELIPHFFYPSKQDDFIPSRISGAKPLNRREAEITLVPMPFLRLRYHLPANLLQRVYDPDILFTVFETAVPMQPIKIFTAQCRIEITGQICSLPPVLFTLFLYFIIRSYETNNENCINEAHFIEISEILRDTEKIACIYGIITKTKFAKSNTGILHLTAENFRSYLTKLNKILTKIFNEQAKNIKISVCGVRPSMRYGIRLAKQYIHFEDTNLETLLFLLNSCQNTSKELP